MPDTHHQAIERGDISLKALPVLIVVALVDGWLWAAASLDAVCRYRNGPLRGLCGDCENARSRLHKAQGLHAHWQRSLPSGAERWWSLASRIHYLLVALACVDKGAILDRKACDTRRLTQSRSRYPAYRTISPAIGDLTST
jgi:hypothetical protein